MDGLASRLRALRFLSSPVWGRPCCPRGPVAPGSPWGPAGPVSPRGPRGAGGAGEEVGRRGVEADAEAHMGLNWLA